MVLSSALARQLRELAFSSEASSNGFQSIAEDFYDCRVGPCFDLDQLMAQLCSTSI